MTTTLTLPGVYFLPPPPRTPLGLPPLNVAAFVGFAERGPLHTPVALDSFAVYGAVFGGDLPVARDEGKGTLYAHLPTAVSTFFANGGQRCYVVRVAGSQATATRLRLPGMLAYDSQGSARLATIAAASVGRWSAQLRLATRLQATPMPVNAFTSLGSNQLVWQTGSAPQAISVGDVLRLTLDNGQQWLFPVTAVTPDTATTLGLSATQTWQRTTTIASPPPTITEVRRLTLDGAVLLLNLTADLLPDGTQLSLELFGDDSSSLQPGDVLWLRLGDGSEAFFPLTTLRHSGSLASPLMPQARATTAALLQPAATPLPAFDPSAWQRVERLRFDLVLQDSPARQTNLAELAFNQGHARFWGEVAYLESSPLHRQSAADGSGQPAVTAATLYRQIASGQRTDEDGRFDTTALAGLLAPLSTAAAAQTYLPLDMLTLLTADDFYGPDEAEIGSDDLATFTAVPFLDPDLVPNPGLAVNNSRTLLAEAFNKYYSRNQRLLGLHSLLFVDEVALISLPDAAQPGWQIVPPPNEPPPLPPVVPPPDWSQFMECVIEEELVGEETAVALPTLMPADPLPQRLANNDDETIPFAQRYPTLLNLQRAIATFCQARHDVVGILCLPAHFEKRQCIEWQETLRQQLGLPRYRTVNSDNHILTDLSYVAVYHPWLLIADAAAPNRLRAIPGDGAVTGSIAAREIRRYAWVAPANMPLHGVLGLSPEFSREDWADLFARQFNLVRPEARDFRLMSAHTLSDDDALLQLSVRRLMILIRKFAMQRGLDYVFESNDERLRLGVQFSLEEMLTFLYERGAFAGSSPQQAFRVVTGEQVNTRQRADEGQFMAQIQVAPSQPLEFITVLLSRLSEGLQVTEV